MLLKANSKATVGGRKRKRYEVFDGALPPDINMNEEAKEGEADPSNDDGFTDVTGKLKRSKRNKTPTT